MIEEIQALNDKYLAWLKDKTQLRLINDNWVEVSTPYLDRHNDYLEIYVRRERNGYLLTDDGFTIEDLQNSGVDLSTKKRKALLETTLNGFGVQVEGARLQVLANKDNFPLRKHNLLQAMLAINDLFYLSAPSVESLFLEDVTAWLDMNEVRYTPKAKFTGKSGYDHVFDFVIPKSRQQPERLMRAINRPSRDTASAFAFSWVDTKDARPANSKAYAILNDEEQNPSQSILEALTNYEVTPILWSHRQETVQELAV